MTNTLTGQKCIDTIAGVRFGVKLMADDFRNTLMTCPKDDNDDHPHHHHHRRHHHHHHYDNNNNNNIYTGGDLT